VSRYGALAVIVLAACESPSLTLRFTLTAGDSQQCIADTGNATTDCADVTMICDGVLSVRIVPPDQPEFPYVTVCAPLIGGQKKLCSIAGVDLPQPTVPVPEQVLEVQMAIFEEKSLEREPDGTYLCPRVEFGANNLPQTAVACFESDASLCPARPAVGGRAYFYPGDEETVVALGCTDLSLLNGPSCKGTNTIPIRATVNDFDTWVPISGAAADRVSVSIAEPRADLSGNYVFTNAAPLDRVPGPGFPATWKAALLFMPQTSYCLEVFEDVAQATRALVCKSVDAMDDESIDITGALLAKDTLDDILGALNKTTFPSAGLVVGVVLNEFNQPVPGVKVSCLPDTCTIEYLAADRMSFSTGGTTSSNGIWISQDATYGSTFSRSDQLRSTYGGLVQGKVTVVVIQESTPAGGT
jgi:hypothetical protein